MITVLLVAHDNELIEASDLMKELTALEGVETVMDITQLIHKED